MILYLILTFLLIFCIFGALHFLLQKKKEQGFLGRGMNLTLFLVTLPQRVEKEEEVSLEEYLKTAEQFYSSLAGLKEPNRLKDFYLAIPILFLRLLSTELESKFIFM